MTAHRNGRTDRGPGQDPTAGEPDREVRRRTPCRSPGRSCPRRAGCGGAPGSSAAGELVGLARQHADRELLVAEVRTGELEALGRLGLVLVDLARVLVGAPCLQLLEGVLVQLVVGLARRVVVGRHGVFHAPGCVVARGGAVGGAGRAVVGRGRPRTGGAPCERRGPRFCARGGRGTSSGRARGRAQDHAPRRARAHLGSAPRRGATSPGRPPAARTATDRTRRTPDGPTSGHDTDRRSGRRVGCGRRGDPASCPVRPGSGGSPTARRNRKVVS